MISAKRAKFLIILKELIRFRECAGWSVLEV